MWKVYIQIPAAIVARMTAGLHGFPQSRKIRGNLSPGTSVTRPNWHLTPHCIKSSAGPCFMGASHNSLYLGDSIHLLTAVNRYHALSSEHCSVVAWAGRFGKSNFSGIPYVRICVFPTYLNVVILSHATGTQLFHE
jgi:hypothetical protein